MSSTPMRLFVAVPLPTEVVAELSSRVDSVRRQFPSLRWTPADRWHLTLTFCGDVAESVAPELEERLARAAARTPPVGLTLGNGGRFDGRVLLVHVDGDLATLRRLAERTGAAARRAGIDVEDRRYRPHVTLARSREPTDLRPAVAALGAQGGPQWTATSVVLVHSTLGGAGVETSYRTVATFPLLSARPVPST